MSISPRHQPHGSIRLSAGLPRSPTSTSDVALIAQQSNWRMPSDIKQAVTKLAPARTKLQLVKATSSHLRSVQRQPERIRKYFEHGPVRYAA